MDRLRVNTDGVQVMAVRWTSLACELRGCGISTSGAGLACQASAAAMNAGHADIETATAALAARVEFGAIKVAEADTCYIANDASSAVTLAGVADPVIEV